MMTDTQAHMKQVMQAIETAFPPGAGLVLIQFDQSGPEGPRANYISNCQRSEMRAALKEVIARWEGQPQVKGNA